MLGADHPKLVPSLIGLGGALREQQRLHEAAAAMTRAVQLAERAHGGDAQVNAESGSRCSVEGSSMSCTF